MPKRLPQIHAKSDAKNQQNQLYKDSMGTQASTTDLVKKNLQKRTNREDKVYKNKNKEVDIPKQSTVERLVE